MPPPLRDHAVLRSTLGRLRFVLHRYLGTSTLGLVNVPRNGPCVVVANHSIAVPWEVAAVVEAWEDHFRGERPLYVMTDDLWFRLPGLAAALHARGFIRATREAAAEVLAGGGSLLVFPGGVREAVRPFWQYRRCDLAGRVGWAKLALDHRATVVPLSILGSHLINPPLIRSRLFGWLSGTRFLGVRWMPLTVGQLLLAGAAFLGIAAAAPVWLGLIAAWLTLWNPVGPYLPLFPCRIRLLWGEPLPVGGSDPIEAAARDLTARTERLIQEGLDRL